MHLATHFLQMTLAVLSQLDCFPIFVTTGDQFPVYGIHIDETKRTQCAVQPTKRLIRFARNSPNCIKRHQARDSFENVCESVFVFVVYTEYLLNSNKQIYAVFARPLIRRLVINCVACDAKWKPHYLNYMKSISFYLLKIYRYMRVFFLFH